MNPKSARTDRSPSSTRCDELVAIPVPLSLKNDLKRLAERDCGKLAATARRLLARSVKDELLKREIADEARMYLQRGLGDLVEVR